MSKNTQSPPIAIYGVHPVMEAIKSKKKVLEVWVAESRNPRILKIQDLCSQNNIPCYLKTKNEFKQWESKNHQGIIAFLSLNTVQYSSLDNFFQENQVHTPYLFILLDSITDPRNLGAIIRTCDYFSVSGVITQTRRAAPITSIVHKTSSGALSFVPIIQVANMTQAINWLKSKDTWVYGMDVSTDTHINECNLKGNIALVLGSEGEGLRRLVRESCDFLVS
ncbi:MAG TPA: 23S rRNA (guanosine(2251)-2'-O)-methyltransferase RlmB, partial [Spirochaetes bacterium]|nr:23S rRNA (guanosine(2251)-2'-O)-methyltransferase RlmB [Spirochaetota bacterium]